VNLLERLRSDAAQAPPAPVGQTVRILGLPRKSGRPTRRDLDRLRAEVTLTRTYTLRDVQAESLFWCRQLGGFVGIVGVGHGKFLISAIAATVMQASRPLLLVPARLRKQTHTEIAKFRTHFRVHSALVVRSYEEISSRPEMLDALAPDLVIADECHSLRHRTAGRTRRVIRYFRDHPDTRFVGMSGTYTSRSLKDYAHLVELALREHSPVPLEYLDLQAWAACVDVGGEPTHYDECLYAPIAQGGDPRAALFELLRDSPGVLMTTTQSCDASIEFRRVPLELPGVVAQAVDRLEARWLSPAGVEITDAAQLAQVRRQLLQGFYYEWAWPGEPDLPWMQTRNAWNRAVRAVIRQGRRGLDTPAQVAAWVDDGGGNAESQEARAAWQEHSHKDPPPVETVWLDPFIAVAVLELLERHPAALVWSVSTAMHQGMADIVPSVPVGTPVPEGADGQLAVSVRSHGTGSNLQAWSVNVLTSMPPSGATMEQLLGRTHRLGQTSDEILVYWFDVHDSVRADVRKAQADAEYVQKTTGQAQKVLAASWITD